MRNTSLPPSESMITQEAVNKWYGQFHVLKNINLQVRQGETHCVMRPIRLRKVDHDSLY